VKTVLEPPKNEPTDPPKDEPTPIKTVLDNPGDPPPADPPKDSPKDEPPKDDEAAKAEAEAWKAVMEGVDDAQPLVVGKDAFGEEVKFGGEELKALYPALQKAGVPADKASAIASAVAAVRGAKLKLENESFVKAINAKADECAKVFGADIDRVRRYATKGLGMMDKALREELYATPVLLNDHRFLRFLAEVGEKLSIDDGGAGAPGTGGDGSYDPANWVKTSNR
jgi:hypothetical protein